MEESETGEEAVPATLLVLSALRVKMECLPGAPSLARARGGGGEADCAIM